VPGAPPPGWAPPEAEAKQPKKRNKKEKNGQEGGGETNGRNNSGSASSKAQTPSGAQTPAGGAGTPRTATPSAGASAKSVPPSLNLSNPKSTQPSSSAAPTPNGLDTPTGEGLDPVQKKIRNLSKKLKAIDELKEKRARGEKMETTQLKKIEGEVEIRRELVTLQASA